MSLDKLYVNELPETSIAKKNMGEHYQKLTVNNLQIHLLRTETTRRLNFCQKKAINNTS